VKMAWPDRIDAGAFEEVERERRRDAQKGRGREQVGGKARKTGRPPVRDAEEVLRERRVATSRRPSCGQRQSHSGKATGRAAASVPPYTSVVDDGDDLARIIALEASRRDKKWR
jgi:hypothetical protein